jgi:SulP family sulfate permease
LRRYTQNLLTARGKLILAGVSPMLFEQLKRTGMLELIGEKNIFLSSEAIGEAANAALRAGRQWLRENEEEEGE